MKEIPDEIAHANMAFGAYFAKTLSTLGIKEIFFSPGSRSTPMIIGIERHSNIKLIPVLDERTAGFLALGLSKRKNVPVALICTSGSALTHWFPAVTEASHSGIPLFLLSADRPPELQNCGAGQTIDQTNIFGKFVRQFLQLEVPQANKKYWDHLVSSLKCGYQNSLGLNPGPVHINFPFREPFLAESRVGFEFDSAGFNFEFEENTYPDSPDHISNLISFSKRPLVVAGQSVDKKHLQNSLSLEKVPIICDSLCSVRQTNKQNLILRYENLLRDQNFVKKATPDIVIVLGPLPTSKTLRKWIENTSAKRIVIEPRGINVDPLCGVSQTFQISYNELSKIEIPPPDQEWIEHWQTAEEIVNAKLTKAFSEELTLFEGKLSYLLSLYLPDHSNLFISNSMPIRDIEWFWKKNASKRKLFGNRGVNGIDGTLGTAIGIAHTADNPSFLITGDLAFLHDSNALLFTKQFQGSLTIFVINNDGGGIFEHLPISKEPEFEKCFATPQKFDLDKLCAAFGIKHSLETSWEQIIEKIKRPIESGIEVIEIVTNRKKDRITRQRLLAISPQSNA